MIEATDLLAGALRSAVALGLPIVAAAAAATILAALAGRWLGWQDATLGQIARLVAVIAFLSVLAGSLGEALAAGVAASLRSLAEGAHPT